MLKFKPGKLYLILVLSFVFLTKVSHAQSDSTQMIPQFDSQLLRLKVPEAFQKNSLKLEIFSDSSWAMFRGGEALQFKEALEIVGLGTKLGEYEIHLENESNYSREYRSRRVFALVSGLTGATYLGIIWDKGWLYQIPGYVALTVAGFRLIESRQLEIMALREQYYINTLVSPSEIKRRVDDYNFQLYQFLSNAGIQFSDS
ncbi:MAG: hypothetical protein K9N35_00670 [Candidatus Marinimicrobia bacterium]|nr:hypothetical protein [Candidatus Neomarinimicrobiota bacterium]